ncbi:MAG: 16S rRNA (guanine(966)-N(2))-methyltransferase RsmD [Burkholderiales bacterium]|nr:16S rRNA (guanine(966)-N(2))-methyltransferase RsmD [Burkholderiales bacterium]OUT76016.1 MAG: 16S rRNA (guanine(966)-N(2))-methyltransferase RsmD [Betaproteobacteria bacterium TMED22]|tara:strand:- start:18383 stop:18925 length:543 start_codon:yes stop_codon:yes gene_type:complete
MANTVRVIGGDLRGRTLRFPDLEGLRPTPDRVRETLFNWLGQRLDGSACLDLFTGSAALAFEAVSRGATCVDAVDVNEKACASAQENCRKAEVANMTVTCSEATDFLRQNKKIFDVVFLDPPFAENTLMEAVLAVLPRHLSNGCRIYVESAQSIEVPQDFKPLRIAKAGRVHFALWEFQR